MRNVLMFALLPADKITCCFPRTELFGFGMNFPHGMNGVNVSTTLPAANSFRKSRLVKVFAKKLFFISYLNSFIIFKLDQ